MSPRQSSSPSSPTASSSTSSSSKTPLVVALVAVGVLVLGLAVFALTRGDDAETTSTTIAPPTGTLDDRLPPELVGEVRDVEVEGAPLPPLASGVPDPAIGMRPPTLVAEAYDGFAHQISPDTADPTLVVFLAHWCPHCNDEIPTLIDLREQGRLPENLQVFGVMTAVDPGRPNFPPSRWIVQKGWPWPAVADGIDFDTQSFQAMDAYGVTGFPFAVVISDGVVTDRWSGSSSADALAERINAAVS